MSDEKKCEYNIIFNHNINIISPQKYYSGNNEEW
jgi:hypothetical protein